ncbi:MAG: FG-GAP-like repeat-containing protein [Ignavibacteria bacterium]|nr:FG-GAP-like repeat-containing protein [Ignavibacteria bacterium]
MFGRWTQILLTGLAGLFLPFSVSIADILFADVTGSAGLTHYINGEGVCILDIDNDGREDIFIAGGNGRNLLYRNLGGMVFEEIAHTAGVDSTGWTRLTIASDFDRDGWIDLFLGCHNLPSRLFRNRGDGTFEDVTSLSGIQNMANTRGGAWFDHDLDGLPDIYVGNFSQPNILCRNNGDGTFSEIAAEVNARGPLTSGLVMGLAVIDYDRDGDGDILMAQDGDRGNILLRREADGLYTDVSDAAGVNLPVMGMGVAVGDYNGDLFPDAYITNLDESTLLRNNGDGTFSDATVEAGVGDLPAHMGWGTFFFDADNDGWPDLYNNNQTGFGGIPNSFYRNRGDGTFEDLSGPSGLLCFNDGLGSAFADLDNDGRLDIVLSGGPSAAGNLKLFRNISTVDNHWIQLTVYPAGLHQTATGVTVELYVDGVPQVQTVATGNGYVSQNTARLHFGTGDAAGIDSVVVYWVDGTMERFISLSTDMHHHLHQGSGVTGIRGEESAPSAFILSQNYPNPFNPGTTISYEISRRARIVLRITDMLGRDVATIVDAVQEPGRHSVVWEAGGHASGVYFYRLQATDSYSGQSGTASGKMLLAR